jgi:hypothetical protein
MKVSTAPPSVSGLTVRGVEVDRWLCSWSWVEPAFSRFLYAELIRPGLRSNAPQYGVDFVALARHAMAARRHRRRVIVLAVVDVAVFLVGLPAVQLTWRPGATWLVVAVCPLLTVAMLLMLVGWHLYVTRARASRTLVGPVEPRDGATPLDDATEARLAALAEMNVIVFGGGIPFVGAGARLDRWKVRIDTTRAGTDDKGRKRTITPLSAEQLQKEITTAVRGSAMPGLEVNNRLFVAGAFASAVDGLLPDPYAAPCPVISRTEIRRRIAGADEHARTYLCMEKKSWYDELVVSLFVRVSQLMTDLFVEFHAYVLLPLAPPVRLAGVYPVTPLGRLASVLRDVVPTTYQLVRHAPGTAFELVKWRLRLARRAARQRRLVRKMGQFNYGAGWGVQSILAARQREQLFTYEDEDTYVQAVRTRILATIVKTVEAHGIDTSDVERQQKTIINHTYRIGDIKGRTVVVGDNTTFNAGLPDLMGSGHDEEDDDHDGG